MKSAVFRISAVATAIGVAVVVATGGRACAPRPSDAGLAATTATGTGAASAAAPPPVETAAPAAYDHEVGVFGPSTKADPHAIRRAVQGLVQGSASAPRPSASATQPTTNAPR